MQAASAILNLAELHVHWHHVTRVTPHLAAKTAKIMFRSMSDGTPLAQGLASVQRLGFGRRVRGSFVPQRLSEQRDSVRN